jgi:pilus assembly protein Flp/PilA
MRRFTHHLVNFLKNEDGPTSVEYAVMLALIIAVCFASVAAFGGTTNNSLSASAQRIKAGS